MQLHMFWALYIHAADAQDVAGDPGEAGRGLGRPARPARALLGARRRPRASSRSATCRRSTRRSIDYYTRGAYDEFWAREGERLHAPTWHEHADIPATMTTGWYDGFPHSDTEYFAAMAAKNTSPQRLIVGPWSHVGMRGDATYTLDVDFGEASIWGVQRYFDEQLAWFDRWLPDDATAQPADEAPVKIFVMGGGSGRKTELGKLDHGGRWRDEQEWPLARAVHDDLPPRTATARSRARRRRTTEPRRFTYDPEDPVPTIGGNYCAVGELPRGRRGHGADVGAPPQPGAAAAEHHDPGPGRPEGVGRVLHRARAVPAARPSAPTCSSTRPSRSRSPSRSPAARASSCAIASSAVDTDFTAKLVDVYPPNEDYPDGYDMLINDSIIRCRYREGFEQRGADGAGRRSTR